MKLWTLTLVGGMLLASPAFAQNINFDDVQSGTVVNATYSAQGVTFTGETPFSENVQVIDGGYDASDIPQFVSFGSNALDGTFGAIDALLSTDTTGQTFTIDVLADPAGYGSPDATVDFFRADNSLIVSVNAGQTVSHTFSYAPSEAFARVVLPRDAFYDNLSLAAAPEPSAWAGLLVGALGLGGLALRRRRA